MEALVCAFSELRIREGARLREGVHEERRPPIPTWTQSRQDAVSWARGRPSCLDTPPDIYEGGLGTQQQCPSTQGDPPKNFRLRHLRGLALYLPGGLPPTSEHESNWLGRLLAGGSLPQPENTAWPLDLPGNGLYSALLGVQLPRDSLGNSASSSSMDLDKDDLSQPGGLEGLGLRPKRSWGASEEATCPLCKRTRSGVLERP
ncbi:uncharacterized protein C16orf90 homolog [Tupaia chinensis]|uniref:uncharacterized protein C16orf90 homolog n=1 Tax=Tupaia chinensis TaxID=246437 RepID=UPI0003C8F09F|nr:uncharacterized protein C16orf90 homolog [Tupaia chinensis]